MPRSAHVAVTALAILGVAGINPLYSQPPAAASPQQPPPTIRTGARLVEVEVVVRDKDGPVKGLTRDDFTLLDQGERRKIAEFSAGASNSSVSGGGAMQPATPLPPGTVSNRVDQSGRPIAGATVLLLDQLNTTLDNQAYTRSQIQKLLDAALGLPTSASFAFVSGCQMAHVRCLAAARHALLLERGWNVERQGLCGAPPLRILASRRRRWRLRRGRSSWVRPA